MYKNKNCWLKVDNKLWNTAKWVCVGIVIIGACLGRHATYLLTAATKGKSTLCVLASQQGRAEQTRAAQPHRVNGLAILDSDLTLEEAISGTTAPKAIVEQLILVDVYYYSFDNKLHKGQLVINKQIKEDVIAIFEHIKEIKFPVEKVIPIVMYNWSDSLSMADNNTSGFNYRKVAGTNRMSNHAFGKAIDINPMQNPYKDKKYISPKGARYNTAVPGTITKNSSITKLFLSQGWKWGGNYKTIKDWQHFDKG